LKLLTLSLIFIFLSISVSAAQTDSKENKLAAVNKIALNCGTDIQVDGKDGFTYLPDHPYSQSSGYGYIAVGEVYTDPNPYFIVGGKDNLGVSIFTRSQYNFDEYKFDL